MFELLASVPGEHAIEHTTGIYIGALLVACVVGIISNWVTHLPYTIALTVVGLMIAVLHIGPDIEETGFSKELIFFVMLPPLLFQGSLHMQLDRLMQHFWPILAFAILGVILSTVLIGGLFYWIAGIGSLLIAFLFGAMITPTDPVSVLALFREQNVPKDLRYLVEGESLFNDGTGVVLFTIILGMVMEGREFQAASAGLEFAKVTGGGLILGSILGIVTFLILTRVHDHLLENAVCLVLAYGSFWLAEVLHVSGVISTVVAGLLIGNYGRRLSMRKKTQETVETFFESIDFIINSFLFLFIGLELQILGREQFVENARAIGAALVAFLVARACAVYLLYWILNLRGRQRPTKWAHVMFWGGLRGSIPIALLLGLPTHTASGEPIDLLIEYRPMLLVAGFSVVCFSLIGQGLTMKPLLRWLDVGGDEENEAQPA